MIKVISFFFVIVVMASCDSTIKRDYYLPQGFVGEVAIIHNIEKGINPSLKEGRLQIVVPDSGIVFLKDKYSAGSIDYKYFEETPNGYIQLKKDDLYDSPKSENAFFWNVL